MFIIKSETLLFTSSFNIRLIIYILYAFDIVQRIKFTIYASGVESLYMVWL